MKKIIQQSLQNSYTYPQYRNRITELYRQGLNTGNEQSEALLEYTKLNESRMNRIEKTLQIEPQVKEKLQNLTQQYIWLVIAEGWCGDAAQIVPVIALLSEQAPNVNLQIVFRDENEELMNLFLTNGGKAIPKMIVLDKNTLDVVAQCGPRPQAAAELVSNYKKEHGVIDNHIKTELQKWYLNDKGLSIQQKIASLVE